jgi:WD40 repeat protein
MCFSRDSNILATAGADDCITLWDASKLLEELDPDEMSISQFPVVKTNSNDQFLLGKYKTKSTNILTLHF